MTDKLKEQLDMKEKQINIMGIGIGMEWKSKIK